MGKHPNECQRRHIEGFGRTGMPQNGPPIDWVGVPIDYGAWKPFWVKCLRHLRHGRENYERKKGSSGARRGHSPNRTNISKIPQIAGIR